MPAASTRAFARREDFRLLTGRGAFTDDLFAPDALHACFLRSPHTHVEIRGVDLFVVRASGTTAVFTSADICRVWLGDLRCPVELSNRDSSPMAKPSRPLMAVGRVRFVGEIVAMTLAETPGAARDAAERIAVDYAPLGVVADAADSLSAPTIWPCTTDNLCLDWERGDAQAVEATMARAARIVSIEVVHNRVVPSPMEPRAALGLYDAATGQYTLHTPSQGVFLLRDQLATQVFAMPPERLRVLTSDVGGGFGARRFPYPEQALVLFAARQVGRSVRWQGDRGEVFLSDAHGRDCMTQARLALDADARMLALSVSATANMGAYLSANAPRVPTLGRSSTVFGAYAIAVAYQRVRLVFTNTAPVEAYRGAGRPESVYVIERLADKSAREFGLSPIELRRRNLIAGSRMPWTTPSGTTIAEADFAGVLDRAVVECDWEGFTARRAASGAQGCRRGIGLSLYLHVTTGPAGEIGRVRVDPAGCVEAWTGTQSSGQGHETVLAELLAERLGVVPETAVVRQGESTTLPQGGGSGSLVISGSSRLGAADAVMAQARAAAARPPGVTGAAVVERNGAFYAPASNRWLDLWSMARGVAKDPGRIDAPRVLEGDCRHAPQSSVPSGCDVCEVEIDEDTGKIAPASYRSVVDLGRSVSPTIVAGQLHGALARRIGQALCEWARYKPRSGQMLTASFFDSAAPRADDLLDFQVSMQDTSYGGNRLGAKGVGELGSIAAPPAVINAVVDALADLGVDHLDMPATPERVWQAL